MFWNIIGNNYKALGEYPQAEASYKTAFAMVPNRIYPLYLLMNLHRDAGRSAEALTMARRVADFTPKVESPATNQMQEEARSFIRDLPD